MLAHDILSIIRSTLIISVVCFPQITSQLRIWRDAWWSAVLWILIYTYVQLITLGLINGLIQVIQWTWLETATGSCVQDWGFCVWEQITERKKYIRDVMLLTDKTKFKRLCEFHAKKRGKKRTSQISFKSDLLFKHLLVDLDTTFSQKKE